MVQHHVQHFRWRGLPFLQPLVALLRVQAQHGKFGLAQAAGVVQQFHRHQRLAHFVYQPGLPGLPGVTGQAALRVVQAQLACQRQQQRTHGHRMQVAVVVAAFQTRQADQRARVALRRAGDVAHQRQTALHIDGAAPARFVEQGHHGCTAAFADGRWKMAGAGAGAGADGRGRWQMAAACFSSSAMLQAAWRAARVGCVPTHMQTCMPICALTCARAAADSPVTV